MAVQLSLQQMSRLAKYAKCHLCTGRSRQHSVQGVQPVEQVCLSCLVRCPVLKAVRQSLAHLQMLAWLHT